LLLASLLGQVLQPSELGRTPNKERLMTKAATTTKATTTKTAAKQDASPTAATRNTLGSFGAADADTHKCAGKCRKEKPVKAFPTVTGTTRRVAECRSCRDARTTAAKGTAG